MPWLPKITLCLFVFGVVSAFAQSAQSPKDEEAAAIPALKSMAAENRLDAELKAATGDADSTDWHSIDPTVVPKREASTAKQVEFKMKLVELTDFCSLARFASLKQVEEMRTLTLAEKKFCEERLRILKPDIR